MREHGSRIRVLVAYVLLYSLFAVGASLTPPTTGLGTVLVSAIAGSLVGIALVYVFSEVECDWKFTSLIVLLGGAVDILCNYLPKTLMLSLDSKTATTILIGLANLGMLASATGTGLLIARGLRHNSYLVLAALVGAVADSFSVYGGPTKHIVSTDAVYYLSWQWGLLGRQGIGPIVGTGDFIFLSLFFAGARKFGWSSVTTLAAMSLAFIIGFASSLIHPQGLPALPFMSIALLIVHKRDLRLERKEWLTVLKLTLVFSLAMAFIVFRSKFR